MAGFDRVSVLPRSAVSSRRGAEAGRHAPKGDESYEASDLRIVPVDSPDPEPKPTFGCSPGLKADFILVSRRRRACRPKTKCVQSLVFLPIYYTHSAYFIQFTAPI